MPAAPAMTPARWAVLAGGLPVVLALIAFATYGWVNGTVIYLADQGQVGYSVGFSAPATGGQARVTSSDGSLTVRAGPGRRIVVRGHLSGSFARPSFSHRSGPDGLALNPQCHVPAGTCSLDLGITVPAGLPVRVSSALGDLDARGLYGTVALADTSGDISVSQLSGTVHVTDGFGTIAASGLSGRIQLDNNTGDIQAAGVTGNTRLQDSFGAISVTGLGAADVVASNNSGDISLTFSKVPQLVHVTDSFGSITLVLPAGPATYQVETRNSFGSTTVSVPQSPSARNVIRASDNSGDITIVTRKPPALQPLPGGPARPAGP